jgi:hypothetical protein
MGADRYLIDKQYTYLKGEVELYGAVTVGAAGAITFQKWNYPQLGQVASPARTYTAATTSSSGAGGITVATQGAEGVLSVVRTGAGLWTLTLQNAYQRLIGINFYSSLAGGVSAIAAIHENTTISNMNSGTSPVRSVIGLALLGVAAGPVLAATDPANGERINLRLTLQMLTAP